MQQQNARLDIAKCLLSSIIATDRNRQLTDRVNDIVHALEVADELIRRSGVPPLPVAEHTLHPPRSTRTRERVVDREDPSLQDILQARRAAQQPTSPNPGRQPKLH